MGKYKYICIYKYQTYLVTYFVYFAATQNEKLTTKIFFFPFGLNFLMNLGAAKKKWWRTACSPRI